MSIATKNSWIKSLATVVVFSGVVLSLMVSFAGCKGDDPEVKPLTIAEQLKGTKWKLESLKINSVSEGELYKEMTLSFTTSSYTSSLGMPIFKSQGTWKWLQGNEVELDGALQTSIRVESNGRLVLTLTWDETVYQPGRTTSLEGQHEFTFVAIP